MSTDKNSGMPPSPRRVALASAVGATIEWYDFYIYGISAALFFPAIFFPGDSDVAGTIASFGVLAGGFLVRPIGGLIGGHVGGPVRAQEGPRRQHGRDGGQHRRRGSAAGAPDDRHLGGGAAGAGPTAGARGARAARARW